MTQFASFSSGAFVICWTPGLVVLLMDGLNCENCHVMKLKRWLLLLAVLNSVMNPCIYSYKDEEMWATFKNLMRCIGNSTRRQRSTNANSKPLSSGHDTGNSQPPSEEMKNDEGLLKNWKLFLFFLFFLRTSVQIWTIFMKRDWSRLEREAAHVSSWSQWVVFVLRLKAVSWRDISPQLLHCWSWFDGDRDLHALLFPLMNANELFCQGLIMSGHIPPILP